MLSLHLLIYQLHIVMDLKQIEEKVRCFLVEDLEIDEEKIAPNALLIRPGEEFAL